MRRSPSRRPTTGKRSGWQKSPARARRILGEPTDETQYQGTLLCRHADVRHGRTAVRAAWSRRRWSWRRRHARRRWHVARRRRLPRRRRALLALSRAAKRESAGLASGGDAETHRTIDVELSLERGSSRDARGATEHSSGEAEHAEIGRAHV